jgi:hypothetical protein
MNTSADVFIWRLSSFTGVRKPQASEVPIRELFRTRRGTWVYPPTFRKLAGNSPSLAGFEHTCSG